MLLQEVKDGGLLCSCDGAGRSDRAAQQVQGELLKLLLQGPAHTSRAQSRLGCKLHANGMQACGEQQACSHTVQLVPQLPCSRVMKGVSSIIGGADRCQDVRPIHNPVCTGDTITKEGQPLGTKQLPVWCTANTPATRDGGSRCTRLSCNALAGMLMLPAELTGIVIAGHPQALLPGQSVVGNKHSRSYSPAQQVTRIHLPACRNTEVGRSHVQACMHG